MLNSYSNGAIKYRKVFLCMERPMHILHYALSFSYLEIFSLTFTANAKPLTMIMI